jgi:hypothetical protein
MLNFRALLVFLAITVSLGLAGQLTPGTISISGAARMLWQHAWSFNKYSSYQYNGQCYLSMEK